VTSEKGLPIVVKSGRSADACCFWHKAYCRPGTKPASKRGQSERRFAIHWL